MNKPAWGHVSRQCIYCGGVGPRTIVAGGYAHKYCIPKGTSRAAQCDDCGEVFVRAPKQCKCGCTLFKKY